MGKTQFILLSIFIIVIGGFGTVASALTKNQALNLKGSELAIFIFAHLVAYSVCCVAGATIQRRLFRSSISTWKVILLLICSTLLCFGFTWAVFEIAEMTLGYEIRENTAMAMTGLVLGSAVMSITITSTELSRSKNRKKN